MVIKNNMKRDRRSVCEATPAMKLDAVLSYSQKEVERECVRLLESKEGPNARSKRNHKIFKVIVKQALRSFPSPVGSLANTSSISSFDVMGVRGNPYHNSKHVLDVLTKVTWFSNNISDKCEGKPDRTLLQIAALCHDTGHGGYGNDSWSELPKAKLSIKLSEGSVLSEATTRSRSFSASFLSRRSRSSSSFASFSSLQSIVSQLSGDGQSTKKFSAFNEAMHALKCVEIVAPYQKRLFPGVNSEDSLDSLVELILQTDLATHQKFLDSYEDTSWYNMVLLLRLADLGHFLSDHRETHIFWVFRIHAEMGTGGRMTLTELAKDTVSFGTTFVLPLLHLAKKVLQPEAWKRLALNYKESIGLWNTKM
jgi:hypothetical protein